MAAVKAFWANPARRAEYAARLKARWTDPEQRKILTAQCQSAMTPEHRAAHGRKMKANYARLTPEEKKARADNISAKLRGRPRTGRAASSESHALAKTWRVRSPEGVTYTFTNMNLWVREHVHLFLPDPSPASKLSLQARTVAGLGQLFQGSKPACSYRGWTAVSRQEQVNKVDPLCRYTVTEDVEGNKKRLTI